MTIFCFPIVCIHIRWKHTTTILCPGKEQEDVYNSFGEAEILLLGLSCFKRDTEMNTKMDDLKIGMDEHNAR